MSYSQPEPLLILSSGQRTGSTLLQRYILSNPRIMMWGEHDGVLGKVIQQMDRLYQWDSMFGHQLETFMDEGYNNFIPNMIPPAEVIANSQRAILETLYAEPARQMGREIWGFKEVLYDANMALYLRNLYPNMRVLYITRHPFNCFLSLIHEEHLKPYEVNIPLHESWSRPKTIQWLDNWTNINESFLDHPEITEDWVFRLTFEQLIADPAAMTGRITEWLQIDHREFDLDVFNHRRYTDRNNGATKPKDRRPRLTWEDLSAEECLLITRPDLRRVAARLGYELPELFQEKRILEHETHF